MKKRMKDRPGLLDDAQRLAEAGRKGDKLIAHITPEEAALLKARGGAGTVNPRTGLLEFYDGSDPMGSGSDYGSSNDGLGGGYADPMGSGSDYTPSAGWNAPDLSGLTGGGIASDPGEQLAAALQNGYQPRDLMTRVSDSLGRSINNFGYGIAKDPLGAALDFALPGGMAMRGLGMKSYSGMLNSAFPGLTSIFGGKTEGEIEAPSEGEAPSAPNPGMASERTESGQPNYQQMGLLGQNMLANSQQQPGQVAQDAIRRAFQVAPKAYNTWDINRFVIPGVQF